MEEEKEYRSHAYRIERYYYKKNDDEQEDASPALVRYRGPVLPADALGPVIRKLGNGAFGDVYLREHGAGKLVACKSIDPVRAVRTFKMTPEEAHDAFLWEAGLLNSMESCPFVVRFLGVSHDHTEMVLEFCAGGELEDAVRRHEGPIPLQQAFVWALQIVTAVKAMHARGLVHKDLKLENVLLRADGTAVLADLGVAQADALVQETEAKVSASGLQDMRYASPERLRHGKEAITAASDMFAVGLVIAYVVLGERHFAGQEAREFAPKVRDGRVEEGMQLDPAHPLTPLIRACLRVKPDDRPTADEAERMLWSLADTCFPSVRDAALALVAHAKTLWVHESRGERALYEPPLVTDKHATKTPDEKSTDVLSEALAFIRDLIARLRVLALFGDGGTGKSSGLARIAAKHLLALPLRPFVAEFWTWSTLNSGPLAVRRALAALGLSEAQIDALREEPFVFLVDALDEVGRDAELGDLSRLLEEWPNAKLIVTCRRNIVPLGEYAARFGVSHRVRYLLPFQPAQVERYLSRRGVANPERVTQGAAKLRELAAIPFVLRLMVPLLLLREESISASRREVYAASVRAWLEHAGRALLLPAVREQLSLAAFEAFAAAVATRMFADGNATRTTIKDDDGDGWSEWARLDALVRRAAEAKYDARDRSRPTLLGKEDYVRQQLAQLREFLEAGSPLQFKEKATVSFMHKSFRDFYYVGQAMTSSREALSCALVTQDKAVARWCADFVDRRAATCYKSPFEGLRERDELKEHLLWDVVEACKDGVSSSVAAANAVTVLNAAGVPFSGRDLSGIRIGPPRGEPRHEGEHAYADLGGATLAGCRLEGANLRFARLQQAYLDGADLSGADMEGVRFGEYANFEGHTGKVYGVAVDPSGTRVVSGSGDKTVRVWDLASGELLHTLEGHTSVVNGVAVDPSGTRVVSGSDDKTVRVWDLASGGLLHTLEGHLDWVRGVAVDPSGTRVVSGSDDYTVRVWDLPSGELLHTLEGHTLDVNGVAVDPSGTRVVSSSDDYTVRVWDLASGELLHTFEGHTKAVHGVAVDPSGTRIVSSSSDTTVRVWDLASGELLRTLEGHTNPVKDVAVDPSGTRVVSGSEDYTVRVWDLASGECLEEQLFGEMPSPGPPHPQFDARSEGNNIFLYERAAQLGGPARLVWRSPPFAFSAKRAVLRGVSGLAPAVRRMLAQRGAELD